MDTNNFILEITDAVQRLLGSDYRVFSKNVTKNNGVTLTGLSIRQEGHNVSPTIYIDEFLDWYKAGISVDLIAKTIISIYREQGGSFQFDVSAITDYKKAKSRIVFQLVNTERNADLLKTIPFRRFLDFSIIFKIFFGSSPMGNAAMTITNEMLDLWNVNAEAIYQIALINTPIIQAYSLKDMQAVVMGIVSGTSIDKESTKPGEMFVLTNKQCVCGCGCILYPHVLENFSKQIERDFFILPSSRHEVILLPDNNEDTHYLLQMVRNINRETLEQEDFLSDNIYFYSRKTKEITIIR